MHFIIRSAVLQRELAQMQGVIERENTIPVLANLLIESVGGDKIRFIGTDLDLTLRSEFEAEEIEEEGRLCVSARKLFEIARLLPDAIVRIKGEPNDWASVKCDRSKFKLPGSTPDAFPDTPKPKDADIQIPAATLRLFIERTIFAITREESRYTLSGAKFEIKNGLMRMVTTDGHRLALIEADNLIKDGSSVVNCLIPHKSVGELSKLLADREEEIGFAADDNHLFFRIGERLLISRLLYGQFPNWEMVLPKNTDKKALIETPVLNLACRRAGLMSDVRSHALKLNLQQNQIAVSAQSADEGEGEEIVQIEYDDSGFDPVDIGFNGEYLHDFFAAAGDKKILFEFHDGASQAQFTIPGEENGIRYKYIVMPMRL